VLIAARAWWVEGEVIGLPVVVDGLAQRVLSEIADQTSRHTRDIGNV